MSILDEQQAMDFAEGMSLLKLADNEKLVFAYVFDQYLEYFDDVGMGECAAFEAAREQADEHIKQLRRKAKYARSRNYHHKKKVRA